MLQDMLSPTYGFPEIVARSGVSAFLVVRTFRRHLATTALGHLRRLRLDLAARLLRDRQDEPVSSIAARCGYTSQPLFSRHSRSAYQKSPLAFRRDAG